MYEANEVEVIVRHPEFVGLGTTAALQKALKQGLHVQFSGPYQAIAGRLYLELEKGAVHEAFEVRSSQFITKEHP